MSSNQFRLLIGAKRQVTLPAEFLEQLQLPERGELLVEVIGDHAVITPLVSVPRTQLPEDLRRVFESRRGAQPSDIPVAQFLKEVGYEGPAEMATAPHLSMQQRLASLTPNERETLKTKTAELRTVGLTEREKQVMEQVTSAQSPPQKAGLAKHTVKSHLPSFERKQSKLRTAKN
jgi:bifunctional DNA-binding transcriptional regulator/antitoxin component of YhaV-PrlF toxin-antitoxin module